MVIYEISAVVLPALRSEFEEYMRQQHIDDVLATGHFSRAYLSKNDERFRILYFARSQESLSEYLNADAPRLREDVVNRFPSGIEITRENWQVAATFEPDGAAC